MHGLGTAAIPPRPRRHRAHPNARHPRPTDPGPRTPPLQRRVRPPCTALPRAQSAWHTDAMHSGVVWGSEFISEQKIAQKILRKNKVLWRRYSACIYHDLRHTEKRRRHLLLW